MFAIGIVHYKQFLLSPNFRFSDKMPQFTLSPPNNGCLDFWLLNNNDFFVLTKEENNPKLYKQQRLKYHEH